MSSQPSFIVNFTVTFSDIGAPLLSVIKQFVKDSLSGDFFNAGKS